MSSNAPAFTLAPGARPLPEYELVRLLGRGGFGEAWSAIGPGGVEVALKFVRLDGTAGDVELRALDVIRNIRHPNLLGLYGAWDAHGYLILGQELGDRTLMDRLKEAVSQGLPGIPTAELLDNMLDAARGIDHLNQKLDIQHRDIKPQNLFLVGGGVKVADFGLVKVMEKTVNSTTAGGMTPAYAPKELFEGKVTTWTDQYSLAVTYVQLRTNRMPFGGSYAEVVAGHMFRDPDLSMLDRADERAVLARALAKVPQERWPSCREFVDALRQAVTSGLPTPVRSGLTGPMQDPRTPVVDPGTFSTATPRTQRTAPPERGAGWRDRKAEPRPRSGVLVGVLMLLTTVAALGVGFYVVMEYEWKPAAAASGKGSTEKVAAVTPPRPRDERPVPSPAASRPQADQPPEHVPNQVPPAPVPNKAVAAPPPKPALRPVPKAPPPPLDWTGPDGVSEAAVKAAQRAWAAYLGREVEESVEVGNGVRMVFVLVPPGRFLMGSPEGEAVPGAVRAPHETPHEVELTKPYYLGKYEVRQAEYEALTRENRSFFKGADLPVEKVSWEEASAYGKWLTAGRKDGCVYRLPTEAEWEYGCRGGRGHSKPFGVGSGRSLDSTQGNFDGNFPYGGAEKGTYLRKTRQAGSYSANVLGLSDMHGNVWEWCQDWYGDYPTDAVIDPTGPTTGSIRVYRGGSWILDAGFCRAAFRSGNEPGNRFNNLGFRLARVPSGGVSR